MSRFVLPVIVAFLALGGAVDAQQITGGFRDPTSGKVWTPDNVGQDDKPVAPADRAFDPQGQVVSSRGVIDQQMPMTIIGPVPVTAGPTVPLVVIGAATLRVVAGGNWEVALDLTNNSASPHFPVLLCRFLNNEKPVAEVRGLLPQVPAATRISSTLQGPRAEIFVDRAACEIQSP